MANVHDNEIISYNVDLYNNKIVFHTKNDNTKITPKVDIVFTSVLAHYFENEIKGSTILDIEKYSIDKFIKDNEMLLKQGKDFCWPIYYDTIEELNEKLLKEQYNYYLISASYGLNGWILAKGYEAIVI